MGVKTTITTTVPTAGHINSASFLGRNAQAMLTQVGSHIDDAAAKLKQLIADAPVSVSGATLEAAGSGYAAANTITLPNGVVITVNTVSSGAVATFTVTNAGSAPPGFTASNPVGQIGTSSNGKGAAFNLTWAPADANIATFNAQIAALS